MHVTIHRHGRRALFVRACTPLDQIPAEALHWLGAIENSDDANLNDHTSMFGLSRTAIEYDVLERGYCATYARGTTPIASRASLPQHHGET